jgi:Sulfotransferase family
MRLTSSVLRASVRATNAAGSILRRAGLPLVSLDEQGLLDAARRATQLDDLGDDGFREPFRMVLQGLEAEARLTLVGRMAARQDILGLLANRLRLEEDSKRHPEIGAQEVPRPLFIVGLPRTGSTLLHHLLAQDPASRVAQAWEVMSPSPPPEARTYRTDPRIAKAARQLAWFDALTPDFKAIHPLGAQLALECIAIMSPTFLASRFHTSYHVPTYQEWLERQDLRPAYRFHRRFLQQLQWRAPAQRWVLKAPAHLFGIRALLDVYPDAGVILTHRDPLEVVGSLASLTTALRGTFSDDVHPEQVGPEMTRRWADGLARALRDRDDGLVPADRFFDVRYVDLVRDPIGTVRSIYDHYGIRFTPAAEERMRRFLARHPKDKHGRHSYTLAEFGLNADEEAARYRTYRERFGL